MYTVSKGPSTLVAKTRRGISQNLDRLDTLRKSVENDDEEISVPKPVFHPINGKKSHAIRTSQPEAISPQHEELVKFIYDSWTAVCKESEDTVSDSNQKNGTSVVFYEESEPNLPDFKPFDLEVWWGKRLFNTITKSIP